MQPLSQNAGNLCSDSQVHPLKSRITAQMRALPGKTLQRFSSLGLKSRITARWLCDYDLQAEPFAGLFPVACTYSCCLSLLKSKAIISSLFALSDFLIMTLIIVTNLNYSSTHTTFGGATLGLVVSENLILVLFVHFESPAIKSMIF